jgi:L-threonylcarbamoyladenylate synthase
MRLYQFEELEQIAFELRNNKAAILPTDTVMGIVSKNRNLIYTIKHRNRSKKLITFVASIDDVPILKPFEIDILKTYWPGQLTIVKKGRAYRMPNDNHLLALIRKVGPLYSSSANLSNQHPVIDHVDAQNIFGNTHTYELVLVEGKQKQEKPSTIIDFDRKKELRIGSLEPSDIIQALLRG